MQSIRTVAAAAMAEISTRASAPGSPLPDPCKALGLPLMQDSTGQQALSVMILQCFEALKVYGREPEQIEALNGMFQMVLADYPIDAITSAFKAYLKTHSEMPAPADIVNLIERGNKPPLDRSVYVAISKRDAHTRTSEEWAYMRDYERYSMTGRMG